MKLSLMFFSTKLKQLYPNTTMKSLVSPVPSFSAMGVIKDNMTASDDVIFIDLCTGQESVFPKEVSVITTKNRAERFEQCNLIVLPEGTDPMEVAESISKIFSQYLGWADSIFEAIAKNMDLQTIIDRTAVILQNPIYIADSSFKMIASWGGDFGEMNPVWRYQQKYSYLPYTIMKNLIDSGEIDKLSNHPRAWLVENSTGFTVYTFISKAIRKEWVHYGNFFIIQLYRPLDACDLEIADYLGMVLSTALYGNTNYLEKSSLYNAHFLAEVIEGTLDDEQVMHDQLKAFGWTIEGNYLLVLFDTSSDNDAIRHHMMALITADYPSPCSTYCGNVLAIFNGTSDQLQKIIVRMKQIGKDFNRKVAVSEEFIDFSKMGTYYDQAHFALLDSPAEGDQQSIVFYRDIFVKHLLKHTCEAIPPCTAALKLKDIDDTRGTEYCHTLLAWLIYERNNIMTAEMLYIHRNTLMKRLKRIEKAIEIDLDDFETRMRMMLSLYDLEQAR